ncbi:MAG: hypothetical protein V4471_01035 [Pseudomonadota bacterium]
MAIENAVYVSEASYNELRQPLLIACSGGGGHIAAIQGLQQYLQYQYKNIKFTKYKPVLFAKNPPSPTQATIETAIGFMHAYGVGAVFQAAVKPTSYPILPDRISFDNEINSLNENEKRKEQRFYQDMLLDTYPAGYASVAVWNILQRNNQVSDLKKLVRLQAKSDKKNYPHVVNYFLNSLTAAAIVKTPYTEIISTQAMALPALCDAVLKYNQWLEENRLPFPKVIIHQYMTDLPTEGAVHFFNPLTKLSLKQQRQMKLYAVGLKEDILQRFFPDGYHFAGVYDVPADQNPMVRAGFKDPDLDNSNKFHIPTEITLKWHKETEKKFSINANELIASIMLGSQAGKDTTKYIETLLKSGFDKVFVFGNNKMIINKIARINKKEKYAGKEIICLGNQGDKEIAALMTRSNFIIIRGGGLSVMEQLAMKHNPGKAILIHHANTDKELTSGISWEDGNVNKLIEGLNEKNIYAEKTSPKQAKRQILEARLLTALKVLNPNQTKWETSIKKMSESALKIFLALLNSTYIKNNNQELLQFFSAYQCIRGNQVAHFRTKWLAALHLALKENTLEEKVDKFYKPAKNEAFFNAEACQIDSLCVEIKQKLEDYCRRRKRSLDNNLISPNRKLTSQKISIAKNLLSKLKKLKYTKKQKKESRLAADLTKFLLTAKSKNTEMIKNSLASEGHLAEILENGLKFLMANYPFSFQNGYQKFFVEITRKLSKEGKKSFSFFQELKFLIKSLVSKLLGKHKTNFTASSGEANAPIIEQRQTDSRIPTSTANNNSNMPSIERTEIGERRQTSSISQANARHFFYQTSEEKNTVTPDQKTKPQHSYCLRKE